jgi:glucose/arabinose dehydrogenase
MNASWRRIGSWLHRFGFLIAGAVCLTGCYAMRPSRGAGQASAVRPRAVNPSDIALPRGYRIEAVATGLTFPTGVTFDADNRPCVVESGYAYGEVWTRPRLLRIDAGKVQEIAAGERNGPWTGVTFHDGNFYVAEGGELEGGRILRIAADGKITALVQNLPSLGDHHSNGPLVGPDGQLYFGQGTASNSGIVGEDNAKFGWLKRHPEFHDVPGQDVTLSGRNVTTKNVLDPASGRRVATGAFLPFGTPSRSGQLIHGSVPCSGSILRVKLEGGAPELVAWGFRNPFGMAFAPDGKLYVSDNGYDERGSRPVWGAPDVLWAVNPGTWYGWPDFVAGIPVGDGRFKAPGKPAPEFLLATHPNQPPRPIARFPVHSSADGFDIARNAAFGHAGEAFVALFGDEARAVGKVLHPVGAKVVRVNLGDGVIEEFAVNRGKRNAPASELRTGGLERPVAARFDPAGQALYVVDFGIMLHDRKGAHPQPGTGVLWKISRAPGGGQ